MDENTAKKDWHVVLGNDGKIDIQINQDGIYKLNSIFFN